MQTEAHMLRQGCKPFTAVDGSFKRIAGCAEALRLLPLVSSARPVYRPPMTQLPVSF